MKGIAAFGFFILFLGGLALVNLSNRVTAPTTTIRAAALTELVGQRWRLAALINVPGAGGQAIEMQFTRGGSVSGNGRCAHFSAIFQLDQSTPAFRDIEVFESTCNEASAPPEVALVNALAETASIAYDGRNIVLLSADQTRLARFGPVPVTGQQ